MKTQEQTENLTVTFPKDLSAYSDLFSKTGIVWGIIGTGLTGKTTLALELAKEWRKENKGKIVCFDPQGNFSKRKLVDYNIDVSNKNWLKALIEKGKNGKYKFRNSLIIIDGFRKSSDENFTSSDVLNLLAWKKEIGFNIIYTNINPSEIFERLTYYTTHYSIFNINGKEGNGSDKIVNYVSFSNAVDTINEYVLMNGKGEYPNFPHIVIDNEKTCYKTREDKTTVSEIINIVQDYTSKENPSQADLMALTNNVFEKIILKWSNIFDGVINPTVADAEDVSDFIIDMCDLILIFSMRSHSLDVMDAPYELPASKIAKLKKHFTKILLTQINKKAFFNELFSFMFLSAYLPSIRKASEHRQLVLKNKGKQKPENN